MVEWGDKGCSKGTLRGGGFKGCTGKQEIRALSLRVSREASTPHLLPGNQILFWEKDLPSLIPFDASTTPGHCFVGQKHVWHPIV